jgi:DNA-binding Lrp family transcriptional regulator
MMHIDEKDKKILDALQHNARKKNSEIAKETGISLETVKYRIKKLEKEGVIRAYQAIVDKEKLGYSFFSYALFQIRGMPPARRNALIDYFSNMSCIAHVFEVYGKWSYLVKIVAKDHRELGAVLDIIKDEFGDAIKDIEILTVLNQLLDLTVIDVQHR